MLNIWHKFWRVMVLVATGMALASCTSTGNQVQNTLGSSQPQAASVQNGTAQPGSTNATALAPENPVSPAGNAASAQATGQTEIAALPPSSTMVFLPVEGTPQDKASSLSGSLQEAASRNGLTLLPSSKAPAADYRIKGYFSALNDGNGTLLVYIWDVLDPSGRRVHRINGQERTSSRNIDPWFAISDVEITKVADTTAARLSSWVASR